MKRTTFESVLSDIYNLGRPKNQVQVADMGIPTVEGVRFKRPTYFHW